MCTGVSASVRTPLESLHSHTQADARPQLPTVGYRHSMHTAASALIWLLWSSTQCPPRRRTSALAHGYGRMKARKSVWHTVRLAMHTWPISFLQSAHSAWPC